MVLSRTRALIRGDEQMKKKKTVPVWAFASCALLAQMALLQARAVDSPASSPTTWPTHGWSKNKPASMDLDEKVLAALDADLASGKYSLVDSFTLIRCGTEVYDKKYPHDYSQIYAKEAKVRGPLTARLTGPYNYFDPAWHPYHHGTELHTLQ